MKRWLSGGLCVVLGCGAAAAVAEELQWRPVSAPKTPSVLTKTTYTTSPSAAPESQVFPEIDPPASAPAFRPVSLARPVVRAQRPDEELSRPLPGGPALIFAQDKDKAPAKKDSKSSTKPGPIEIIPVQPRVLETTPLTSEPCEVGSSTTTVRQGGNILIDECCEPCCDPCPPSCGILDDCCGMQCWNGCCPPRPCFWVRGEYLVWAIKNDNYPALVTRSTNPSDLGLLRRPSTEVLFGNDQRDDDYLHGGRFGAGFWLPCHDCIGFEVGYFFLNERSQSLTFGPDSQSVISRPFTEVNPGVIGPNGKIVPAPFDRVQFVNVPDIVEGTAKVDTYARLWGVEGNVRHKLWCGPCAWVDLLYGYRHFELAEGIRITENLRTLSDISLGGAVLPAGTRFVVKDRFDTRNYFDGGQIGIDGEFQFRPRWSIGGFAKVALGTVRNRVDISGSTFDSASGETGQGGLLTSVTNIGRHERSRFAVMPEAGLRLNYDLTDHLRLYVSYNFLYLSHAVRPGEQIDTKVNSGFRAGATPNLVAVNQGPRNPAVLFRTSDFWAQGVGFGLEYRW